MKSKTKRIIAVLFPLVALPFAYVIFKKYSALHIPCPFNLFTGIYCFGCGGTRCIDAIMHGKFILALRENAIVVFALIFLFLAWLGNLLSLFGKRVKTIPENRIFYITVSGIIILYAVIKNFIPVTAPV